MNSNTTRHGAKIMLPIDFYTRSNTILCKSYQLKKIVSLSLAMMIALLSSLTLSGCSKASPQPITRTGYYFNTVITVSLYTEDEQNAQQLLDGCMELSNKYENLFSMQKEGTDVWNINHANGAPVSVDNETAALIQTALYYAKLSDGRFNPAIGAVTSLWDFTADHPTVPDAASLTKALEHVDYTQVKIETNDDNMATVTLQDPQLQLDLGAIAKGYIADQLKEYLTDHGIESGMINLGGNVLVIGSRPDGESYNIGIQKPFGQASDVITSLAVTDRSVVSSGVYERYFEVDGQKYHHILDPATGYPVDNDLLGVTILSDLSVDGDGLSTTCFALGLEDGLKLINHTDNVEAIFITSDYQLHYSDGLSK